MKTLETSSKIFIIIILLTIVYLVVSFYVPSIRPKWYGKMNKDAAEIRVNQDPTFKLIKENFTLRIEKDSLQHLVDSLQSKK